MLCCVTEIAMLVIGIMALAQGKVKLWSRTGVVYGTPARLAGVFLILPLPINLGIGFVLGLNQGIQGKEFGPAEQGQVAIIEPIITLVCLLIASVILIAGKDSGGPPSQMGDDEDPGRWKYE